MSIVPEIDLPGHSKAIFKSYPNAVNVAKLPFEINLPGQALACLDPDDEPTMQMVESAFRQICDLTRGRYIHIGADETFGMQDDKYVRFVKRIRRLVHSLGKEIVGWQEMARAEVGTGDIVQNWIAFSKKQIESRKRHSSSSKTVKAKSVSNSDTLTAKANELQKVYDYLGRIYKKAPTDIPTAVSKGAKILLSPQAFCYLDCPYEEESFDSLQNTKRHSVGLQQYTPQNCEDMYDWNPTTFQSSAKWKEDIAGVEAAIWGESIRSFGDMQFLLLPRLTGVADRAWGASRGTTWEEYSSHLAYQSLIWRLLNWTYFKSKLVNWK